MKKIVDSIYYILIILLVALSAYSGYLSINKTERYSVNGIDSVRQNKPLMRFTAAGDYGFNTNSAKVLNLIDSLNPNFHLALGDLVYRDIAYRESINSSENEWCSFVKDFVKVPFEIVAGNHDTEDQGARYDAIINCLPNTLSKKLYFQGEYGKEYYFEYPEGSPLARIIMISPDITLDGEKYLFTKGSSRLNWLRSRIDSAKSKRTPWIIVGMHKMCLSAGGNKDCEIGEEIMDLMIEKKVDLVLTGHEHIYARSHQLTCADHDRYLSECVIKKENSEYNKGEGTIFLTVGTGGQNNLYPINNKHVAYPYFTKTIDDESAHGVIEITATANSLFANFYDSEGQIRDYFEINNK